MPTKSTPRIHPAWIVACVALLALVGAAGFRATPGLMIVPLQEEFGWSTTVIGAAIGVNILLYGLMAPFAAALMERFGMRVVTACALMLITAGFATSTLVNSPWGLVLTWGFLIGIGSGSMALVFVATVVQNWFTERKGLVSGILSAGSAAGQLIFLPITAVLVSDVGWRIASLFVAGLALAVVPLVLLFLKNKPEDVGVRRYGETQAQAEEREKNTPHSNGENPAIRALTVLKEASRSKTFWALTAGFAICGATTNGLIGVHFIPSAHDHGMSETTAAGLLALVGIFDILGTVASGWLTDRINPRILLGIYYFGRGIGLMLLPFLLSDAIHPSLIIFVIIYGLDWVATVPPTLALCREAFGMTGALVFGWVFAAHQVGASIASVTAGVIRDNTGDYFYAWIGGAVLCVVAAWISFRIKKTSAVTL